MSAAHSSRPVVLRRYCDNVSRIKPIRFHRSSLIASNSLCCPLMPEHNTEQATKTLCRNKETRNLVTTSTINVNRHSISFDWPMYKETFCCDRDLHFISAVLLYTTARNSDITNANILPIPIKSRSFKRSFNETSQQADDIRRQKYHSNDRRVLHNTPRTEYNR